MMSENIARNIQSSQGIINYPTHLQLVGHFRILYTILMFDISLKKMKRDQNMDFM